MQRAIGSTFTVLFFATLLGGWAWNWTWHDGLMFAKLAAGIAVTLALLFSMAVVSQAAEGTHDTRVRRCLSVFIMALFLALFFLLTKVVAKV